MAEYSDRVNRALDNMKKNKHKGGENLKMIDSKEMAREYQRRSAEARKKNNEERKALQDFIKATAGMKEEIGDIAPDGLTMMKMAMMTYYKDGDLERAAQVAAQIAPYETPKLASTENINKNVDYKGMSDEEFLKLVKSLEKDNGKV